MCSSSPVRTPKLQLTALQPLTGECWISPKKETLCSQAKEKHQKDGRRSAIAFRIQSPTMKDTQGHKQKLCIPGPREKSSNLRKKLSKTCLECLSVSCKGMDQQWPAMGSASLTAADLGGTMCGISPLGGGHH